MPICSLCVSKARRWWRLWVICINFFFITLHSSSRLQNAHYQLNHLIRECVFRLSGSFFFFFLPPHPHRSFSLWLQPTEYVQVCGLLTQNSSFCILHVYPSVYQEQDNFNPKKNEHQWNAKGDRKRVKEEKKKNNWLAVWFIQMKSVCFFHVNSFFSVWKIFVAKTNVFFLR